jgi:hypothetical protein
VPTAHPQPSWLARVADLDPRSLAIARIGLAALTLIDLGARFEDLDAFYTDEGVLPRAVVHLPDWDFLWSFHTLGGGRAFMVGLFAVHAVCALALLLGAWTRVAAVLCFVFAASLQARNPLLRDGHDDLLRVLLFFGIFLPWGTCFSIDARRRVREGALAPFPAPPSFGALGYLGQLCLVYWAGAIGKLESPWWRSGHAISNALSLGRYETVLGHWLLRFPTALRLGEPLVLVVEVFAPALLWLPVRQPIIRTAVVVTMVLLHASFGACLRLGLFPLVSATAWLAVIPGEVWDRLRLRTRPSPVAPEPRWIRFPVVAGLLIALGANVLVLGPDLPLARPLGRLASLAGLQQYWLLFAPTNDEASRLEDGYYVEAAQRRSGEMTDLMAADGQLSWQRPPLISATYGNRRWRHYLANLRLSFPVASSQFRTLMASRQAYAAFLCRRESEGGQAISRVSVYFLSYRFGHPEDTPTRTLLAQAFCN